MIVRKAEYRDLSQLLDLYTHLHDNPMPIIDGEVDKLWRAIVDDPNHYVLVGVIGDTIISSCVLIVVPNLTHQQRPYAFIENVVTHPDYRGKGCATQILNHSREIAASNRCYKIMLMTGSKDASTLSFYERAGYNMNDKTAFVQWLD